MFCDDWGQLCGQTYHRADVILNSLTEGLCKTQNRVDEIDKLLQRGGISGIVYSNNVSDALCLDRELNMWQENRELRSVILGKMVLICRLLKKGSFTHIVCLPWWVGGCCSGVWCVARLWQI